LPQPPQCASSSWKSTQSVPHRSFGQLPLSAWQAPLTHATVLPQAFPHCPQCWVFVLGLTHALPHLIVPFLHFFVFLFFFFFFFFGLASALSHPSRAASTEAPTEPSSDRRDGAARVRVK
jgi:hypothetical protein